MFDKYMDQPRVSECKARCLKFAEITDTDTVLAMFYLQDADWDLHRSLLAFIPERRTKPFFPLDPKSKVAGKCTSEGNIDTDKTEDSCSSAEDPGDEQLVYTRNAASCDVNDQTKIKEICVRMKNIQIPVDREPYRIRIMSWNIDGLNIEDIKVRVLGVIDTINREEPHVVLLQEVVIPAQKIIEEKCPLYELVPAADEGYYTAVLLRWDVTTLENFRVLPFYTSRMSRNLLHVKCTVKGIKFDILTSHLESMRESSEERKKQLRFAFDHVKLVDIDRTVIFGGDLNLRNYELSQIGGLPEDVDDIWEVTGAQPETEFTWDVQHNDNLEWSKHSFGNKPRLRFDRIYIRHCKPKATVKPVHFELVGQERMRSCRKFPSDHWGLLSHFNILSRMV
ncbi:hypothetical protein ACJMK2_003854 [Sinanodonta woodiana]|uniref:Tyrosyl-DNA phosphodiesterase 2 n=1 Tax=Sinanodonta woodiana TaxID=1069815 RepID=A0ABD3Y2F6_SINWO